MTASAYEPRPPDVVWPALRAWADDIRTEDFSPAVSLETLSEAWKHRQQSLAAVVAEETGDGQSDTSAPAWLPDETCPVPYDHVRHLQQHGDPFAGWYPTSAA